MKFDIYKKEWKDNENGTGKKIVAHSKLKFFWGHGEHEWPLVFVVTSAKTTDITCKFHSN